MPSSSCTKRRGWEVSGFTLCSLGTHSGRRTTGCAELSDVRRRDVHIGDVQGAMRLEALERFEPCFLLLRNPARWAGPPRASRPGRRGRLRYTWLWEVAQQGVSERLLAPWHPANRSLTLAALKCRAEVVNRRILGTGLRTAAGPWHPELGSKKPAGRKVPPLQGFYRTGTEIGSGYFTFSLMRFMASSTLARLLKLLTRK